MPLSISSPPDISGIIANLGTLTLAVTAVVAGLYTGWQKVKKAMTEDAENSSARSVSEISSNRLLTDSNSAVAEAIRKLNVCLDDLNDNLREHRQSVRTSTEENYRLRIAMQDLHQLIRSLKP